MVTQYSSVYTSRTTYCEASAEPEGMNASGHDRDKPYIDSALRADEVTRAQGPPKESEHWLRSVVRGTSGVIMVLDADGTIRYVNPTVERILGYKAEELIGAKAFDLVHPEDAERAKQTFSEVVQRPGVQTPVEFRLRYADGSWRRVEVVRNNLLDDPNVEGILARSHLINTIRAPQRLRVRSNFDLEKAKNCRS